MYRPPIDPGYGAFADAISGGVQGAIAHVGAGRARRDEQARYAAEMQRRQQMDAQEAEDRQRARALQGYALGEVSEDEAYEMSPMASMRPASPLAAITGGAMPAPAGPMNMRQPMGITEALMGGARGAFAGVEPAMERRLRPGVRQVGGMFIDSARSPAAMARQPEADPMDVLRARLEVEDEFDERKVARRRDVPADALREATGATGGTRRTSGTGSGRARTRSGEGGAQRGTASGSGGTGTPAQQLAGARGMVETIIGQRLQGGVGGAAISDADWQQITAQYPRADRNVLNAHAQRFWRQQRGGNAEPQEVSREQRRMSRGPLSFATAAAARNALAGMPTSQAVAELRRLGRSDAEIQQILPGVSLSRR